MVERFPLATAAVCLLLLCACANAPVTGETKGDCIVTPPAEPTACTMQYDPVCGCDGKTYSNACVARSAGVTSIAQGACEAVDDT